MLKIKIFRYALMITFIGICSYSTDNAHSMDSMDKGDDDYKIFKSSLKRKDKAYTNHGRKKNANRVIESLEAGAKKGHPECQKELAHYYKHGVVIKLKTRNPSVYTTIDLEKSKYWQNKYDSNQENPLYDNIQSRLKKEQQEEEEKKELEPIRLQLELEQAKIRRIELELQQAQSKSQPHVNYQQQPVRNNFERNIRIADGMINMANDGVNLFDNLQNNDFF